ncbi:MAG: toprim domain-containing protein [Parafilimonas sp.]
MKCAEDNTFSLSISVTIFSFEQQSTSVNHEEESPFHLHENSLINHKDAAETAIEIIAAKKPITHLMLCRYLKERRIDKNIADRYFYEVTFKFSNKDAKHTAIGFKNSAGGYELRNSFFKLSSSPKYITYINNTEQNRDTQTDVVSNHFNNSNELKSKYKNDIENLLIHSSIVSQNDVSKSSAEIISKNKIEYQNQLIKQSKSIAVFEGFFDFLTYQTIHQNQTQPLTNFLVLNALSFFERSLRLMEKHDSIHLYLDQNNAGKKCPDIALKRSHRYKDESSLYNRYKDLNDWMMHLGKLQQKQF